MTTNSPYRQCQRALLPTVTQLNLTESPNWTKAHAQYPNELWSAPFIIVSQAPNLKQMETNKSERITNVPLAKSLDQPEV